MNTTKLILLTIATTIAAFVLGMSNFTSQYQFQMFLISLLVLFVITYTVFKKNNRLSDSPIFVFTLIASTLLLVISTGWYFSPFFFILYLLPILLAFLYPKAVSISLVITLIFLFSFNIGKINSTYDILIILSLCSSIPLTSLLRREYLKLKENEKKILIIEDEKNKYKTTLEEVLGNKVSKFSVDIRQPINDIRSLTSYLMEHKNPENIDKYLTMIQTTSEEGLRLLRQFEEDTTGKKLLLSQVENK